MTYSVDRQNSPRYARPQQWLHWSIAVLVLGQLALAVVLSQLRSLSFGQTVLGLHQQLGMVVLLLVSARLIMARGHAQPPAVAGLPHWQHLIANLTHRLFLVLLVVQPVIGIGMAWARGDAIRPLWIVSIESPFEISEAQQEWLTLAHIAAAGMLALLVSLHVGAVVFNRVRRGISVLDRMLPPVSDGELRNRMPIVLQLGLAFGLVIAVALGASGYAIHKYRDVTALQATLQEGDVRALEALHGAQMAVKDLVGLGQNETAAHADDLVSAARSGIDEAASLTTSVDTNKLLGKFAGRLGSLADSPRPWSASALRQLDTGVQEAVDLQSTALFQLRTEHDEQAARGHDLIVVAMLPMLLAGIVISVLMARSMAGSIDRMRRLVGAVGGGQLEVAIRVTGRGEFSVLMQEMLGMSRALKDRTTEEADRQRRQELDHARQLQEARERELAVKADADLKEQRERMRQEELRSALQEQEAAARLEEAARASVEREQQRRALAMQFEVQVEAIVAGLDETVSELRTTASEMTRLAGDSAQRSREAERMAEQTSTTAAQIARGASSLSESANRMRGQATGSRDGALTAINEAAEAGVAIHGLAQATEQIGQIAEVISDIARQTMLLSLNARIEAARAGEAGLGFAVVATEVKDLAARTRLATDGIDAHIRQVTGAAQQSIQFLQRIGHRIEELGTSAGSILQCAEDQCGATGQISDQMSAITRSTESVVTGVQAAQGTATETEQISAAVLGAAERMQEQTRRMQQQVARFVLEIQSGQSVAVTEKMASQGVALRATA